MKWRATLTAFSTASEPELKSAERFSCVPGVSSSSASRDLEVLLVRRDHEAGVGEVVDLLGDRVDDALVAVADGRHGDAGAEVDELVAVDVAQDAAGGLLDVDRQSGADAGGHRGELALAAGPATSGRG